MLSLLWARLQLLTEAECGNMRYAPHKLQVCRHQEPIEDEFGRPIQSAMDTWEDVGRCRCDDSGDVELIDENGKVYRPQYHVVVEGHMTIKSGDKVQCLKSNGEVRGSGIVHNPKVLNYLQFSEFYL